jgi:hypothetical protein
MRDPPWCRIRSKLYKPPDPRVGHKVVSMAPGREYANRTLRATGMSPSGSRTARGLDLFSYAAGLQECSELRSGCTTYELLEAIKRDAAIGQRISMNLADRGAPACRLSAT